ncbi:hypothetical protein AB1L42_23760 [Thalassoglobus sp. JC818]|uniref:hypothetical protein n=1 Tax=Thalassoglobus sp. JC818 TaxID=3232136 RepID=UPI00345A5503
MDRFQVPGRISKTALFLAACGLIFVAIGIIFRESNWFVASILPWTLFAFLLSTYSPGQVISFEDDALKFDDGREIPYEDIQGISIGTRIPGHRSETFPSGPMRISHRQGIETLKGLPRKEAAQVYHQLIDRIPTTGSDSVAEPLVGRLQRDRETFDSELVSSYCARQSRDLDGNDLRLATYTIIVATIAMGLSLYFEESAWIVRLVGVVIICLICFIGSTTKPSLIKNAERSSLVISPRGLALLQGPLVGQIKWEEIREVSCKPSTMGYYPIPAITILVPGARIQINDVYDRPLGIIYERIQTFWEDD